MSLSLLPPDLAAKLPNLDTPWYTTPEVFEELSSQPQENGYARCEITESGHKKEYDFVHASPKNERSLRSSSSFRDSNSYFVRACTERNKAIF